MGRMSDSATRARPIRRALFGAVGVLALLAIVASAGHLHAASLERTARDPSAAFRSRAAAIERARALEPWSERFEVTAAIVEAERLLDAGKVDAAYFLLLPYSTTVRDDPLFRAVYQEAARRKLPLDARKAHQQHAKEKDGGALDPEDVFK
jgi:hypothetical protein